MKPAEGSPLILASAADDAYAMPLAVTLFSALSNLGREVEAIVFVFDGGISPENKQRLEDLVVGCNGARVCIRWLEAATDAGGDVLAEGHWMSQHISAAALLRLHLPEVIPSEYPWAIYLDSDTMVEGDLLRLWAERDERHALLAVQDPWIPFVGSAYGLDPYAELGLPIDLPYFNSGVILANLERWRSLDVTRRATEYLREYKGRTPFMDQDALNAVFAGSWKPLDIRWNQLGVVHLEGWGREEPLSPEVFPAHEAYDEAYSAVEDELIRDPWIVHFAGPVKPWHPACEHPLRWRFLHVLRRSGWFTLSAWLRFCARLVVCRQWQLFKVRSRPYRPPLQDVKAWGTTLLSRTGESSNRSADHI